LQILDPIIKLKGVFEWIWRRRWQILERYPGLEIELSCSDQTVDLVRDGIDYVIRSGTIAPVNNTDAISFGSKKNVRDCLASRVEPAPFFL